jgi:hypothetical protein
MQKSLLLLTAAIMPVLSQAQVSLDLSKAPPINSSIIYYDANVPVGFSFGKSGTGNDWNFTMVAPVAGEDDTTFVLDPADLPLGADFPTATHATIDNGDDTYSLLEINSSGVSFLGMMADFTGTGGWRSLHIQPALTSMSFPYQFGAPSRTVAGTAEVYATGAEIGQPQLDSAHYVQDLSTRIDALASGTLTVPGGAFDAFLERRINTSTLTLYVKGAITGNVWMPAGAPTTDVDSAFYWYTNESLLPYAHALYDDTGLHDVRFYRSSLSTGIEKPQRSLFAVYPNPANESIRLSLPLAAPVQFELLSSNGELKRRGMTAGSIPVGDLASGMYLVRLRFEDGSVQTARFLKN